METFHRHMVFILCKLYIQSPTPTPKPHPSAVFLTGSKKMSPQG